MSSDVSEELLKKINRSFTLSYQNSKKIKKLLEAIRNRDCDYLKAMDYAEEVGRILAEAYMENLSSDVLPDGKMYYNIASKILNPTMENNYGLISSYTCGVMDVMNEKAGMEVKARKPAYNASRTAGLIRKVSNADIFDDVKSCLNEPVITNALSIVDEAARTNADFHYNLGYAPTIVRTAEAGCCKWCRNLAGVRKYSPDMDRDIFRRHENCRCQVIYDPGNRDGKVQDVYTKEWNDRADADHSSDMKEYKEYLDLLGEKNVPSSLSEFQKLKYNDTEKFNDLALQFKDSKLQKEIIESYNLTLREGQQGKHILGHNNYIAGRSYIDASMEDIQRSILTHAGKGKLMKDRKGAWDNTEIIVDKALKGYVLNLDNELVRTSKFKIHYSKAKGTHLVPTLREVKKDD